MIAYCRSASRFRLHRLSRQQRYQRSKSWFSCTFSCSRRRLCYCYPSARPLLQESARRRRCFYDPTWRTLATQGYQSLGSFHNDKLSDLLHPDDPIPSLPFEDRDDIEAASWASDETASRYHRRHHQHFRYLDLQNWTFLNHGAFGAALNVGHRRADAWRRFLESQPLRYFDRHLLPHLAISTRRLAALVSNDPENHHSAVLPHATAGLHAVLASHARTYGSEASIAIWDTTYGSVKKMAQHCSTKVYEIPLVTRLLSSDGDPDDEAVAALQEFLNSKLLRKCQALEHVLFVLDQTTSNTAVTMPLHRLARIVKQHCGLERCWVVVDGAHGLLAQPSPLIQQGENDITDIDVYVTNGHKWLACPRGVALLTATSPQVAVALRPVTISHGYDEPDLLSRFVWDGTRDYAAALAVPAVLDFWDDFGSEKARTTSRQTLATGCNFLVGEWHGGTAPPSCFAHDYDNPRSQMALVRLPMRLGWRNSTSTDAKRIQDALFNQNVEVPIKCIAGELYVRVSCHVYNTEEDFHELVKAIERIT